MYQESTFGKKTSLQKKNEKKKKLHFAKNV